MNLGRSPSGPGQLAGAALRSTPAKAGEGPRVAGVASRSLAETGAGERHFGEASLGPFPAAGRGAATPRPRQALPSPQTCGEGAALPPGSRYCRKARRSQRNLP